MDVEVSEQDLLGSLHSDGLGGGDDVHRALTDHRRGARHLCHLTGPLVAPEAAPAREPHHSDGADHLLLAGTQGRGAWTIDAADQLLTLRGRSGDLNHYALLRASG